MDNKKFVDIVIKNIIDYLNKSYKENNKNKKILEHKEYAVQDATSILLSIIDEWGGGYFDDSKDNDGHFELYYVSDEEGKYKYRVDEGCLDLFLERMEIINEKKKL